MKTILVIDDEPEIVDDICTILELEGYSTARAKNGRVGLERLQEQVPDLIVCDIWMPEMDGYEFLDTLRASDQWASIPFIFLSATSPSEDARRQQTNRADVYMQKPFFTEQLLKVINDLLSE